MNTTFNVSNVTPATTLLPETRSHEAIATLTGPVESCSQYHGNLLNYVHSHPLIAALHGAFMSHRPVCLSPDIIWLTITQGLAQHINMRSEELRHHFVKHKDKIKIHIRKDDFVKGSPENPWPEAFSEFSNAIKGHIGNTHNLIVADFSTTGPVERAASEIALLDSMQKFFSFEMASMCGIPTINLEGTVADWRSILHKVRQFKPFGLEWWVKSLETILEQFVLAVNGKVDREFWDCIYKWNGPDGSGSPYVSGWIASLFPYLVYFRPDLPMIRNHWVGRFNEETGPTKDMFPRAPSKAPFLWKFPDRQFEMEMVGGLVGVEQDHESLCLKPKIGWAVKEESAKPVEYIEDHNAYKYSL